MADPGSAVGQLVNELAVCRDRVQQMERAGDDPKQREALALARATLEGLFELSPEAVVVLDEGGRIAHMNRRAERLFGWTRSELIGLEHDILAADRSRDEFRTAMAAGLADPVEGTTAPGPALAVRRKDGTEFAAETHFSRSRTPSGRGVLVVFKDVTERNRAETMRRDAEARFRHALDSLLEGCLIVDRDWRVVYVNDAAARQMRRGRSEVVGRVLPQAAPDVERSTLFARLLECMRTGAPQRMEAEYTFPDGHTGWFELFVQQVPEGIFILSLDISQRKASDDAIRRAVDELARSNQDLEQFAYAASHDLREPLRSIITASQMLARRYRGRLDSDADQLIGYVVGWAGWLDEMIAGLLDYSRMTGAHEALERIPAEEALGRAAAALSTKTAELRAVVTHDPLPVVTFGSKRLMRLFQNLLDNALKFHGPEPPRVHVSCGERSGEYEFSVRDNGIGIAPEDQQRLVRMFERFHSRDAYPGTGVGLAICRKIVERGGGRIWVESVVGKGSTFRFTIPR
ncbi:MAG: PAS domain S-box protein [Deltaproteobacteria bacterium]|nr:PAS domain S-box protein [Deltaproteobacteria bacterium]